MILCKAMWHPDGARAWAGTRQRPARPGAEHCYMAECAALALRRWARTEVRVRIAEWQDCQCQ